MMSMPQFGPEMAKDRIDRLIEEARSAAFSEARAARTEGFLRRVAGRLRAALPGWGPRGDPNLGIDRRGQSGGRRTTGDRPTTGTGGSAF
jgi:hypothetical protein